jgi:hypothetical protein
MSSRPRSEADKRLHIILAAAAGASRRRRRPMHRKYRDGVDKGCNPPKVTLAPVKWLERPELPLSARERTLIKFAIPADTAMNGKTAPHVAQSPPMTGLDIHPPLPPRSNGGAPERTEETALLALAEKEERERNEACERSAIAAGKSAWGRLKKDGSRLHDFRLIGEALLAGRRVCIRAVGANKPRGIRYVTTYARWLQQHGFSEIVKTTRTTSALIAENWSQVNAWLRTLPAERRIRLCHPQVVWREFKRCDREPKAIQNEGKTTWRDRQSMSEVQAKLAVDAVRQILPCDDPVEIVATAFRAAGFSWPRSLGPSREPPSG